ncbi:MAG: hypothetical protein AAGL69_07520 [Pseudomonadota bacterium]
MHNPCIKRIMILTALLACTACGSVGKVFDRRQSATNQPLTVEASTVSLYLSDIRTLLEGDAKSQARVWDELQLDFTRAPTTTNRLRLALALATPGHPWTNAAQADGMLTELLLQPELLLSDEQVLAAVQLNMLRSRLSAETEARQAGTSATRTSERELAAARAQVELLRSDNSRLRTELEEAEEKLRAITLIERSIRERNGANSNTGEIGSDIDE